MSLWIFSPILVLDASATNHFQNGTSYRLYLGPQQLAIMQERSISASQTIPQAKKKRLQIQETARTTRIRVAKALLSHRSVNNNDKLLELLSVMQSKILLQLLHHLVPLNHRLCLNNWVPHKYRPRRTLQRLTKML